MITANKHKLSSKPNTKKAKLTEPPLPNPFPLPVNYAPCVTDGMARGKLTGKARTKFISTVTSKIFGLKTTPTKSELQEVAKYIPSSGCYY